MSKTIIVSNRLPVKVSEKEGDFSVTTSEGGLATGLGSIYKQGNNIWIGWPGIVLEGEEGRQEITDKLKDVNLYPVFLSQEEINLFYEGFSNEILWPVFHYMTTYARYQRSYWDSYAKVNEKFRDAVLNLAEPGDIIWVHDYQLLLLPALIRAEQPDITIGFFQHIPFPSYELFRLIPWRSELLEGMLGADLIGFHTWDDAQHFVHTARRLLPVISSSNIITTNSRSVLVDSFPMGIDSARFESMPTTPEVRKEVELLKENFDGVKIILSIDRLDYSKGILQRLQAFELFLQSHPQHFEKVVLYMIVVPSRDTVPQYKELRDEIDKFVGNINARYRTISWQPVYYFYRPFPIETLAALYTMADVCLVTPMRDGMNLVCKEYVASRVNNDGVLILSEMAGASRELIDALIVNPNNIEAISASIQEAVEMPASEKERRMVSMRQVVSKFNISHWVKIFMNRLAEVKAMQESMLAKHLVARTREHIKWQYGKAAKRVILLDYDGTLVGFHANIDQAAPDSQLYSILESLIADKMNIVVIISGRDPKFLEKWFNDMPINIIAEHGAWVRRVGEKWSSIPGLNAAWKKELMPVLETFSDRTPGAFIEEKEYSLVWHYRKVEEGLGELRANELMSTLRYLAEDKGLQLLPGNKVIEVKNVEINKGKAAVQFVGNDNYEYIMAMGDDHTDEDIFKALPESAITIKVGSHISAARYYLGNYQDVRKFLSEIAEAPVIRPSSSTHEEQHKPGLLKKIAKMFTK